jgi:voltage-gated potassium channel Kch
MLFGDLFISSSWSPFLQTILILQNMLFSLLLFHKAGHLKKIAAVVFVILATATRTYPQFQPEISNYLFVVFYLCYFSLVSYQLFWDLLFENELGIETLSAAFSGFILIGTVSSIIFVTMDSSGAFRGPGGEISYSDYLYFSFVTLLTIGYGDFVPITDIAKKSIILIGLIGHFYTVFVVGIVIGKFLKGQKAEESVK